MAWYGIGTITLTNGSKVVTGAGVGWTIENIRSGDALAPNGGVPVEIESIDGPTQLTLRRPWLGATAANVEYSILPTQDYNAASAANLAALMLRYTTIANTIGQGLFPAGTNATPGIRFQSDQDTGLTNPAANVLAGVTAGVERVRWDSSGQTVFGQMLLQSPVATRLPVFSIFRPGYGVWQIGGRPDGVDESDGTAPLRMGFNGSTFATITNSGNVGVGTTAPGSILDVRSAGGRVTMNTVNSDGGFITKAQDYSNSPYALCFLTNLAAGGVMELQAGNNLAYRPITLNRAGGNVGVGTQTPISKFHVNSPGSVANVCTVGNDIGAARLGVDANGAAALRTYIGQPIIFGQDNLGGVTADWGRFDTNGNLLIGATSGNRHTIAKSVASNAGAIILGIEGASETTVAFYGVTGGDLGNAANAAFKINRDAVTQRSINAYGTINASGADMAEYKRKAAGCGPIAKGDVCGIVPVGCQGELTTTFADAVDFVVKSTKPHTVGGDTWGQSASIAPCGDPIGDEPKAPAEPIAPAAVELPDLPAFDEVAPTAFDEPAPPPFDEAEPETPVAPPAFDVPPPPADASDEDVALWAEQESAARMARYRFLAAMAPVEAWQARRDAAAQALVDWTAHRDAALAATAAYEQRRAAHDTAVAERETQIAEHDARVEAHAVAHAEWAAAMAQYAIDHAAWKARHDAARATVDRIAIAGQCPVRVTGPFAPGDCVVAMERADGGIEARAFHPADMTPELERRRVGRVWGTTEETEDWPAGLAWCVVRVG